MSTGTSSGYASTTALLSAATQTATGAAKSFNHSISPKAVQATVTGTGAVSATVLIDVSNDAVGWINAGTISLSGTTSATDGFVLAAPWISMRARLTAISGTGATVDASVAV